MGIFFGLLAAGGIAAAYQLGVGRSASEPQIPRESAADTPTVAAQKAAKPYHDTFLTGEVTRRTASLANERSSPSPKGSKILNNYPAGIELQGRMVAGITPGTQWLKTGTGYVWDGNLEPFVSKQQQAYVDRFISGDTMAYVTGKAFERSLPSPDQGVVLTEYRSGAELTGRWVAGVTPGTRWFKTATGYVWEGNLTGG